MATLLRLSCLTFDRVSICGSVFSIKIKMSSQHPRGTSPGQSDCFRSNKLIYPAATRNCQPILDVLKEVIPVHFKGKDKLAFMEIASGSGQHTSFFAKHFSNIQFQPTEYARELFDSISIYADAAVNNNIKKPIFVDISEKIVDSEGQFTNIDIIYCSNMVHIAPYKCAIGLFVNAGVILSNGGLLITYGPYAVNGVITAESNVNFDKSLRYQNKEWGVRCLDKLNVLAGENGLIQRKIFDMPANNKCVVWEKVI